MSELVNCNEAYVERFYDYVIEGFNLEELKEMPASIAAQVLTEISMNIMKWQGMPKELFLESVEKLWEENECGKALGRK